MIACLDVFYRDNGGASTAVVMLENWASSAAALEKVIEIDTVAPYEPGSFYKRELPCLIAVLAAVPEPTAIVINGYVWLDEGRPGLGAHLHEALGRKVPVVGVAKTSFQSATTACEVLRGTSQRPLYVTAEGLPVDEAARHVRDMHGEHRLPMMLRRVDGLCRRGVVG